MIQSVKLLDDPKYEYVLQDGKIGYKQFDDIKTDLFCGYHTIFAYIQENERFPNLIT